MLIKGPFNPRVRWDLIDKAFCDCRSQKDFRETASQKILKHREKPGLAPTTTQKARKTQQPAQLSALWSTRIPAKGWRLCSSERVKRELGFNLPSQKQPNTEGCFQGAYY